MVNETFDGALGPAQEDFEVGDDADMPGLSGPLTTDDIDAVVHSPRYSEGEKRALLTRMRSRLVARTAMDPAGDASALARYLEDAITRLDGSGVDEASPSSYGFDPESRTN